MLLTQSWQEVQSLQVAAFRSPHSICQHAERILTIHHTQVGMIRSVQRDFKCALQPADMTLV